MITYRINVYYKNVEFIDYQYTVFINTHEDIYNYTIFLKKYFKENNINATVWYGKFLIQIIFHNMKDISFYKIYYDSDELKI